MANVEIVSSSFNESGDQITGEVTCEITFTETEKSLEMGFRARTILRASNASTESVVLSNNPRMGGLICLDDRRREKWVGLGELVHPGGKSTRQVTIPVSMNRADLFEYGHLVQKWLEQSNRGIDVVRVEIEPDFGGSKSRTLKDQRL